MVVVAAVEEVEAADRSSGGVGKPKRAGISQVY